MSKEYYIASTKENVIFWDINNGIMKRENTKKKIFIVHNLLNLETKQQVTDYIDNVLKKSPFPN